MSRKLSLTVLVVGALFVAMQAPTASACWRHRHHRVATYYSPHYSPCCTTAWGGGYGLDYAPYHYGHGVGYSSVHATRSFYRPYTYSTVGHWGPGYHAAAYSPAFGYHRPARFGGVGMGVGIGGRTGVWTSGYYGSFGYGNPYWYGW
jgi:hypothetical protein